MLSKHLHMDSGKLIIVVYILSMLNKTNNNIYYDVDFVMFSKQVFNVSKCRFGIFVSAADGYRRRHCCSVPCRRRQAVRGRAEASADPAHLPCDSRSILHGFRGSRWSGRDDETLCCALLPVPVDIERPAQHSCVSTRGRTRIRHRGECRVRVLSRTRSCVRSCYARG